ncbi:MAG: hypothetical protein E5X09_19040 [Mesorhizobium sp.]|nr:MAG: hypothetical protein E5X09_19040 [Mesorhizobium sp.]
MVFDKQEPHRPSLFGNASIRVAPGFRKRGPAVRTDSLKAIDSLDPRTRQTPAEIGSVGQPEGPIRSRDG